MDDWSYWCHHKDKLRKPAPPKRESLDPSWYTDNIYSNHSLDLEKDMVPDYVKFDNFFARNYKDNTDDDDLLFGLPAKPKAPNINRDRAASYKYPKSRSCCFGSSYEAQKPPQLLPKSHTFCNARTSANFAKIREIKNAYDHPPPPQQHQQQQRGCRHVRTSAPASDHYRSDCEVDERNYRANDYYSDGRKNFASKSYPEDAHAYRKRKNEMMIHAQSKAEYIRNEWLRKNNVNKMSTGGCMARDKNKNYCDYYRQRPDQRQQQAYGNRVAAHHRNSIFDEDFFMDNDDDDDDDECDDYLDDTNPFGDDTSMRHNHRRRSSSYDTEFDPYLNNNARSSSMLNDDHFDNDFLNNFSHTPTKSILRNKTMLEVKPPSRYDETSSDSTDVDLDDFNFDFKKYWKELEKNGVAMHTPFNDDDDDDDDDDIDDEDNIGDAGGIDVDDLDEQNNNTYNNLHTNCVGVKEKNVNLDRYNNGTLIDDNLERTNDTYFMHNNNNSNILYDLSMAQPHPLVAPPIIPFAQHHHHLLHSQPNDPLLSDPGCSGSAAYMMDNGYLLNSNIGAAAATATMTPGSPFNRLNRKIHPQRSFYRNFFTHPADMATAPHLGDHLHPPTAQLYNQRHNAISLINNIFSIYKPKKYSPVNCHTPHPIGIKAGQCKKMNVPSTIRPLGAPQNDFITSLKRPLLVQPPPCIEQPHFKIIPQKTGLKISPLYRFDFDNDNKFRMKSTARPLLFPH